MHIPTGHGMFEFELVGMKHHSWSALDFVVRFSVYGFTDNWTAYVRHVNSYLLRTAGFQAQFKLACMAKALNNFEMGDCFFTRYLIGNNCSTAIRCAAYAARQRISILQWPTYHDTAIAAASAVFGKLHGELFLCTATA